MKRNGKKAVTIIIVCVLVAGVVTGGVLYSQGFFGSSNNSSSATTYSVVKLTTGDLESSVTGTGTLAAGGSATETVPVDLKVESVAVKVGQNVAAGDTIATIDAASIADTITALESEINSIDSSIARLASSEASVSKLTSSVSGRVKQLLCSAGDDVEKVMMSYNGLFVLSTDGKMKVDITLAKANSVATGAKVVVKTGGGAYTGLVEDLSEDGLTCTVTLTDNGTTLGADATVSTTDGSKLGSGKLEINRPYYVTGTAGTVSKIYVNANTRISNRTALAYLTGIPTSDTYNALVKSREETMALLKTALALQQAGKLTASEAGTIQTLSVAAGQDVKSGASLMSMLTLESIKLSVSVDELDINSIAVGQTASIAIDAVSDKTYEGTVESISQIGTTSNGVTNYTVNIQMAADTALKVGMNATATIVIEKHSGVLLLPLEAVQAMQGKSFVWLYTGTLPTDSSQDPGTKTEITTGMSNDNYVEITSGLTADDQVVVVRTKSTSSGNMRGGFGGFGGMTGGMGGMGGQMPGGDRPQGDFPRGGN